VEPYWRPARSFQLRYDHPTQSNMHMAPGSFGNEFKEENFEFMKRKTYLEWNPPNNKNNIDTFKYDRVLPYDITREN
jgi:hypothetical protein